MQDGDMPLRVRSAAAYLNVAVRLSAWVIVIVIEREVRVTSPLHRSRPRQWPGVAGEGHDRAGG
jgi:hypothetical protein